MEDSNNSNQERWVMMAGGCEDNSSQLDDEATDVPRVQSSVLVA
jgi:hypothetical protein